MLDFKVLSGIKDNMEINEILENKLPLKITRSSLPD